MSEEDRTGAGDQETRKQALAHRMESIGWALFFIMIGGMWLIPGTSIPEGTWLIGAGIIMLGVNLAKRSQGIAMNGFTIVVGVVALAFGVAEFMRVELPFLPIIVILLGLSIIVGHVFRPGGRQK
jgi:hypothetical protein